MTDLDRCDAEEAAALELLRQGAEPLWPHLMYLADWRVERALIRAEFELAKGASCAK